MKKKFLFISLISLFLIALSTYSFASTNMMNSAKNTIMNAGNKVSNATSATMNAIENGAKSIVNGSETLGNDVVDDAKDMDSSDMSMLGSSTSDYTAERTATTNSNLLGFSDTTWTWLILGIVGIIIVSLVWYYGAQYDHRNYSND